MVIETINPSNIDFYKKLILDNKINENTLAFGARVEDLPCGVIVCEENEAKEKQWDVKMFFVSPIFRRQGAGGGLLTAAIDKIKVFGGKKIVFQAITSLKSIEELESLLCKYGFSKPELLTAVYRFNPEVLISNNLFVKLAEKSFIKCPENVRLLPAEEVDEQLLEQVKAKTSFDYPDILSPFANEFELSSVNSWFAVSNDGEIVGWLTGLGAPGNIILYRSFFVREDYRETALGFFMLNECVKSHVANYKDKAVLFAVSLDNKKTLKLFSLYFKNAYEHKKHEFLTFVYL